MSLNYILPPLPIHQKGVMVQFSHRRLMKYLAKVSGYKKLLKI